MSLRPLLAGLVAVSGVALLWPSSAQPAGGSVDADFGRTMLVLDASGSMSQPAGGGQTRIAAAKSALRTVVNGLPDEAQVGLRVFGAEVFSRSDAGACTDSQVVVEPGVDNRDALLEAIGEYQPYGETPIPHALREAAKDLGDRGQRSIVLVSDGESTCDPDPCEVAAELAEAGIDLQIDVVGLSVSGKAREQLRCIAEQGNGIYYDADSAEDIEQRLQRAASRALRPFTLTGTPIEGGPEDDPTPVSVGDWTDELGPVRSATESKSYFVEKSAVGSTLRVSAHAQGETTDDGVEVEILDDDGARCNIGKAFRQVGARSIVAAQAAASDSVGCDEPGRYRIKVSRVFGSDSTLPFALRVTEEPPVLDPGAPPLAEPELVAPRVSGQPHQVDGGTSFAYASPIDPGRWHSNLVPGESLLYRFSLDFGQEARVSVRYPRATPAMRDVIGSEQLTSELHVLNPMQAQLPSPDTGFRLSGQVGSVNGIEDYSMAGDYYLAVSLEREEYTLEFPITIDLEIVGEPADGPTYAEGVTWSVADGATAEPTESDTSDEDSPAARDGGSDGQSARWTTAAAVAGLLVIGAGVGALLLWRRRRPN